MRVRRLCDLALLCVAIVSLTAAPTAAQQVPLKIGIIPISDLLPLFVVKEKNFDREEGLTLDLVPMAGGAVIQPAVAGGSLQIGLTNSVSFLAAREQGFSFVILAPNSNAAGMGGIFARGDSPITSLKDLEGKTLAVNTLNGIAWMYAREAIARAGGNPDRVTYVEAPFPQLTGMLENKQIDAALLSEPFITMARAKPHLRFLSMTFDVVNPGGVVAFFVATKEWAAANADVARRFARAYGKGVDYVNANPAEARLILTKYTRLTAEMAQKITLPIYKRTVDVDNLKLSADLMLQHRLLKKPVTVEDLQNDVWR